MPKRQGPITIPSDGPEWNLDRTKSGVPWNYRPPSLLITDDDKAFRETLRSVLGRFGFEMLLAEDGEQAIEIISRTKVHLALFDVHMPRMSGLEALAHLRDSGLSMPCILMSAQLDDEIREEATRMEVASVLSKPVKIHDVSLAVTETLEQAYGWTG